MSAAADDKDGKEGKGVAGRRKREASDGDAADRAPAAKRVRGVDRRYLESGPAARGWLVSTATRPELAEFLQRFHGRFPTRHWAHSRDALLTQARATAANIDDDVVIGFVRQRFAARNREATARDEMRAKEKAERQRMVRVRARALTDFRFAVDLLSSAPELVLQCTFMSTVARFPSQFVLAVRTDHEPYTTIVAGTVAASNFRHFLFPHSLGGDPLPSPDAEYAIKRMFPPPTFTPRRDVVVARDGVHVRIPAHECKLTLRRPPEYASMQMPVTDTDDDDDDDVDESEPDVPDDDDADRYRPLSWFAKTPSLLSPRWLFRAQLSDTVAWQALTRAAPAIPFEIATIIFHYLDSPPRKP